MDDEETTRLRVLVHEALDFAEEGWAYATEYFRCKWRYEEEMERLRGEAGPREES